MSSQADVIEQMSDAEIQERLAQAVKLYAGRVERDGALPAFNADAVNATEVMVTVTAMLKAANLQVFELGMWQAWAGK
ncbi:MAG: hypothetical protein ABI830_14340 [Pseudolabrys sp.]